jgi:titin
VQIDSNTIAFNVGTGLAQQAGPVVTSLASNAIFSNGKLGIDLGDDGPTMNDAGDTDPGPNRLQNFPVLQSVDTGPGIILVQGTLQSIPRATYTVELFASPTCDPSGFGQGRRPLGTTAVTTDASGEVAFEARLRVTVTPGELVTATATDSDGNTSEFSPCRPAVVSLLLAAGPTASPTPWAIAPALSSVASTPSPLPTVRAPVLRPPFR